MSRRGTWKKERASGRKYSGGDSHPAPRTRSRREYWVAGYVKKRGRITVRGHMRKNSAYRR